MSFNELFGLGGLSEPAILNLFAPYQDDAASTAVDDVSSNANDGDTVGGDNTSVLSGTGPNGWLAKALHLDGANDWVTHYNSLGYALASKLSLSLWLKPDAAFAAFNVMFAKQASSFKGWAVRNGGPGEREKLAFQLHDGTNQILVQSTANVFSSSTWNHIAVTYDGSGTPGGINLYLNGSLVATSTLASDTLSLGITHTDAASVGARDSTGAGKLDGLVCGVTATADEYTAAEIAEIYGGPELVYSSGVSFSSAGAYDIGTWALPTPFSSGSNGTPTYEVIAVNAAGTVLDGTKTTATGTMDLSAEIGNACYLLARVSNTGGYNIGDSATRTSGYGSANDGYYEVANVTAASGGPSTANKSNLLAGCWL